MRRRFAVLVVCTANICRSPLAELLLTARLDRRRFEVASAGVRGWEDHPIDESVQQQALRLGVDGSSFRSRPLLSVHVANADLILTATREHRGGVLELDPTALRRTFTLREFAALGHEVAAGPDLPELVRTAASRRSTGPVDIDVPDPFRAEPDTHRRVADLVDDSVRDIARHLGHV
ncbi:hypothetical protein ACHAAC_02610 [Aeromicrobium sp. CF4.19]|uniref:arsenate reductase/protein-tyrosine-phosphatase family protein n=1 Tax=Aeromicrobium sp. CF4.19 TaxID=3373082 RepID=UPI003EE48014